MSACMQSQRWQHLRAVGIDVLDHCADVPFAIAGVDVADVAHTGGKQVGHAPCRGVYTSVIRPIIGIDDRHHLAPALSLQDQMHLYEEPQESNKIEFR